MSPWELWHFFPIGYLLTIAIETPVLFFGLSPHHPKLRRIAAGFWLTGCTYPIVVLVLPLLLSERWVFLLVAETFAPLAECALFWLAFGKEARWRDFVVIVIANLASFLMGAVIF
ncbi:MAG TPA: hypothetical protein VGP59_07385 [Pyrinomonadaceae bacterium]|nr:hypothetical protein [Pyrinomonadaceae bacterium]